MITPEEIYNKFNETDHGQEIWNIAREVYPDYTTDNEEKSSATEYILEQIIDWYEGNTGLIIDSDNEDELFEIIFAGLS